MLTVLRSLLQSWLRNAAKAKVGQAVVQAAAAQSPAEEPKPCHLGIVFALGIESGCFEDLLSGVVTIRGKDFVVHQGGLKGRRVVTILSGAGSRNAARAAEALIDGHRPLRVISAPAHYENWIATVEFHTRLLEPVRAEDLTAVGSIIRVGRRIATARAEIHSGSGTLVATGTGSFTATGVPIQ